MRFSGAGWVERKSKRELPLPTFPILSHSDTAAFVPAVGQFQRDHRGHLCTGKRQIAIAAGLLGGGQHSQPHLHGHRTGHPFRGVLRQRVRYLVTHYLRQFVVGRLELVDQAGVDRHLAAGHAPGIDGLGIVDHLDAPFPALCFRSIFDRLSDQPSGDCPHPRGYRRVAVDLAFLLQRLQHRHVGLLRFRDGLVLGDQHQLLATGDRIGLAGAQREHCERQSEQCLIHGMRSSACIQGAVYCPS